MIIILFEIQMWFQIIISLLQVILKNVIQKFYFLNAKYFKEDCVVKLIQTNYSIYDKNLRFIDEKENIKDQLLTW